MRLLSIVPSTMGTLMASGLMGAGRALEKEGINTIDAKGYVVYLKGFTDGISARGKCAPGDRTVLDAIYPAYQASKSLFESKEDVDLLMISEAALKGAKQGLEETKMMKPKFGKAVVFSDISEGKADQGAFAGMCMLMGHHNYILKL